MGPSLATPAGGSQRSCGHLAAEVGNDQVQPEQHGDSAEAEADVGQVVDPHRGGGLAVSGDGGQPDAKRVEHHHGHSGGERGTGYDQEFHPLHRCVSSDLFSLARAARDRARPFFLAKRTACPASSTSTALWWPKIGRAHVWNSSHLVISYAVFCLKKKTNV